MEAIEYLIGMPHKGETFLIVIAAVLSVQFLVKLWDWIKDRFEIDTKSTKREKMQTESINKLEKEVDTIKEEIKEIKDNSKHATKKRIEFEESVSESLREIKKEIIQNKIDTLREGILDFSNACKCREYSKEAYDNALKNYDKYEAILKQNGMSNG